MYIWVGCTWIKSCWERSHRDGDIDVSIMTNEKARFGNPANQEFLLCCSCCMCHHPNQTLEFHYFNDGVYVLSCKLVLGSLGLGISFLFDLEHCGLLCYLCDFVVLCLLYELPWQANPRISFCNHFWLY